jgi:ribosomal protein S18 acetylase RimI-like enzyme
VTATGNIAIRPYHESDRPALEALTVAAFDGVSIDQNIDRLLGPVAGRDWRYRKTQHLAFDLDAGDAELAVAAEVDSDRPVGYVSFHFQRAQTVGWIHNLALAAEYRGLGLGRRLLLHALERFRAEGMTVAQIETLEQNAIGRQLFPSLGFGEVARKIYYAMPLGPAGQRDSERTGEAGP